jgi:hypothetical protein
VEARLRISGVRRGVLFVPFHYGYWDTGHPDGPGSDGPGRAANELTLTDWDPVSKQPLFKTAAARAVVVEKSDGTPAPAPTTAASRPVSGVPETVGGEAAMADEDLGSTGGGR